MAEDIVAVVNKMGEKERMTDGIQFHNIHHESTILDLYANEIGHDDNSCVSDNDWKDKKNPEQDLKNLLDDMDIDDDELEDINDLGDEDELHSMMG